MCLWLTFSAANRRSSYTLHSFFTTTRATRQLRHGQEFSEQHPDQRVCWRSWWSRWVGYGASARINSPGRRTVPIGSSCDRDVERLLLGVVGGPKGSRIANVAFPMQAGAAARPIPTVSFTTSRARRQSPRPTTTTIICANAPCRRPHQQPSGSYGPIEGPCERELTFAPLWSLAILRRSRSMQMLQDPQTAFAVVVLGLLCAAILYVALRSP
jgi:hypothetical protein